MTGKQRGGPAKSVFVDTRLPSDTSALTEADIHWINYGTEWVDCPNADRRPGRVRGRWAFLSSQLWISTLVVSVAPPLGRGTMAPEDFHREHGWSSAT